MGYTVVLSQSPTFFPHNQTFLSVSTNITFTGLQPYTGYFVRVIALTANDGAHINSHPSAVGGPFFTLKYPRPPTPLAPTLEGRSSSMLNISLVQALSSVPHYPFAQGLELRLRTHPLRMCTADLAVSGDACVGSFRFVPALAWFSRSLGVQLYLGSPSVYRWTTNGDRAS